MTARKIFEVENDGRLLPRGNDLTNEQLAALDLKRHIVVTAGAGSGKTRTLSRRVLRILGDFAWRAVTAPTEPQRGPRNILVSTFTERAAAELQERIREELLVGMRELEQRIDEFNKHASLEPGIAASLLRELRSYYDRLDEGRIGTFHGFCAAALREFSADLCIDPGFTILQGPDHVAALEEVVEHSVASLEEAQSGSTGAPEPLVTASGMLFRSFSRRTLLEILQAWLERRGELGPFSQVLDSHTDNDLIERWVRCYGGAGLDDLELKIGSSSSIQELLTAICAQEASFNGPDEHRPPVFTISEAALRVTTEAVPVGSAARGQRLRDFISPFLAGQGALRKPHSSWLGTKKHFDDGAHARLSATWSELRLELTELFGESAEVLRTLPGRADEEGLPILRALNTVAQEVVRRFQARKARDSQLDFADLELDVLRLLREHPRARLRLQRRYEHLLIDEFQDTNAVQWSIVKLLSGSPLPDNGLFLVGDPKQAIYRFRGGDVTLFDRAIAEVCSDENPPLSFSFNFRSRPELINGFNHLFSWLMHSDGPDRPSWEAPFTSLRAGRAQTEEQAPGRIEMLWLRGDAAPTTADDSAAQPLTSTAQNPLLAAAMPLGREASLVAQRLRDDYLPTAAEHKGIKAAILLRRRTHLPAYAFALRQAGIPHVVAKGRGFFARQEVLDVANLLLALSAPDDGIALIGALRGPFLGLEDAWLLWLTMLGNSAPQQALRVGWNRCLKGAVEANHPELWNELPVEGQTIIRSAARQFHRWQQLRKQLPLSAFLREVLRESAAYHLFHLNDVSGQALANIEKLQALAARYDHRGAEGLADFALFLRDQEEAKTNEGDASIDATAPVVLMTIHQSKGLEFPIVVLPDLQQKISITDTKALGCARLGERVDGEDLWEVGLQVPIEDGQRAYESMVLRTLIRERNRAEQLAESRRLLYVAMTRARDQLLCVSRPPSKAAASPRGLEGSKSWEEWIRSWLDAGGDALVTTSTDVDPSAKDHIGEAPGTSDEQTAPRAEDIQPLTANCSRVITPHALTKTDQKAESHSVGPPGEGAQLGKLRGLLVHSCLEDGLYETSEETERRLCSSLAREGLLSEDLLSLLREELDRHLRGFKAAAPEQLLHTNQDSVFRELPFRLSLPNDAGWLKGVIDLVYRDEARQCWVVLDYKSDSSVPSELSERYRGQLTAYAWAASQVLPDLTQNGWRVETQLLCTAHGARHVVTPAATADEVARQFSTVLSTEL